MGRIMHYCCACVRVLGCGCTTTTTTLGSYTLAVSVAVGVGLGMRAVVQRMERRGLRGGRLAAMQMLAPFTAVATAGVFNVGAMRYREALYEAPAPAPAPAAAAARSLP